LKKREIRWNYNPAVYVEGIHVGNFLPKFARASILPRLKNMARDNNNQK